MKMQKNAREVALAALVRCEKSGYSNLVLADELKKSGLVGRDRAFAARLVYGTVERKLTLRARLAPFLQRPLDQMPAELRCILYSGLYQALYMDSVPVSAAVNESVALSKKSGQGKAAGFVNAVLRRAAEGGQTPAFQDETERLSVTYSVGRPVAGLLRKRYPERAEEICAASFRPPALVVRVNTLKTTDDELIKKLADEQVFAKGAGLAHALILEGAKDVTALACFQEGLFHVQGLASQLAAAALAVQKSDRVLDVCAAPGGKTATLAQSLGEKGSLTACELHQNRLPLIKTLLARIGAQNTAVCQKDAAVWDEALGLFDKVLCDVPCSGLGTLAKKPDIRYKDLDGLPTLIETQKNILNTAARYLAAGGVLVYSTCTINPQENERVTDEFLTRHPDWEADLPDYSAFGGQTAGSGVLFLPTAGMDGFFIARLRKRA